MDVNNSFFIKAMKGEKGLRVAGGGSGWGERVRGRRAG
jgi:hypothetical protein